jgi:hypothetical protein
MLIYYPTEHIYWLSTHKVLNVPEADKYSRYSCRAWAIYILLDLYQIVVGLSENKRLLEQFEKSVNSSLYAGYLSTPAAAPSAGTSSRSSGLGTAVENEFMSMTKRKELFALRKQKKRLSWRLVGACCDLPMALHWSTASYPLNDLVVSSLGALSGLVSWYLTWTAAD